MKHKTLISALGLLAVVIWSSDGLAAGDPVKGEKLAKKCAACHTMTEGGKNRLGPNLYGIINQPAGKVEGYKYSKAMANSGLVWDPATFSEFVQKPKKVIKGTKMSFRGFKKATDRADLVAYFETLGASPQSHKGDIEQGRKVAEKHCIVCHTFEKDGKVIFGPNLWNMAGKPAASIDGYKYSDALKNSGLTWTDKNLLGFLSDPEQFLPGTTARFPGLTSAQEKADVIAYMKSLK